MKFRLATMACAVGALLATMPAAQGNDLKIGFITTQDHPIGRQQLNGWQLGLKAEGWTKDDDALGGVSTRIVYGDDQNKADVGRRVVDRMLQNDDVDIVAGIIWSNVMMAAQLPVVRDERILLSTNAGPSPLAGAQCSPFDVSTSWQNDQPAEATGRLMSEDGVKTAFVLAPNYQAGKDSAAGMERGFDGKVIGQSFFRLGQTDFQAELTRVRAANPEAVYIFAPGPMGIGFLKQWAASGLKDKVRLYTAFSVDWLTLGAIGGEAVGSAHSMYWNVDLDNEANAKFVKDYVAEFDSMPAHFAAQAYDAPRLIAAGLKEVGGNVKDRRALVKAMRSVDYGSVRGKYEYNVNGFPIQNFYRREVVMEDGRPKIATRGIVFENHKDSYWEQCPEGSR